MGIVKSFFELEEYMEQNSLNWNLLRDKQYRKIISEWRDSFEESLSDGRIIRGSKAIDAVYQHLPIDVYFFSIPNYKFLPVTKSSEVNFTFGYEVFSITTIDRIIFNRLELVICDRNFNFTCYFNHEAPDLVPEIYCEC